MFCSTELPGEVHFSHFGQFFFFFQKKKEISCNSESSDGSKAGAPGSDQNFLNFMQFLGKFVCWCLPMVGWRPLLRGILDPPLERELNGQIYSDSCPFFNLYEMHKSTYNFRVYYLDYLQYKLVRLFSLCLLS